VTGKHHACENRFQVSTVVDSKPAVGPGKLNYSTIPIVIVDIVPNTALLDTLQLERLSNRYGTETEVVRKQ
jgi:hypothetical protein